MEACKSTHASSGASYEEFVSITDTASSDLDWVIENIKAYNGKSFRTPSFSHTIESDASSLGWGARHGEHHTGSHWSPKEATYHINYLELLAVFLALKCFACDNARVCLKTDNTTVVAYINKMGGIGSPMLNTLAREIWFWCLTRNIFVTAVPIPGQKNIHADCYSRNFNERTEWSLHPTVYQWAT